MKLWFREVTLSKVQCHAIPPPRRLNPAFILASWSSRESPEIMMSFIILRTPGRPSSILFILFRKYSGTDGIPEGSLRKQYLPNAVMNVVSSSELGERGICQNPELASSFVKTSGPASLPSHHLPSVDQTLGPSVWSTEGRWCFSLCTLSFSQVHADTYLLFLHLVTLLRNTFTLRHNNHAGAPICRIFYFANHCLQQWNWNTPQCGDCEWLGVTTQGFPQAIK